MNISKSECVKIVNNKIKKLEDFLGAPENEEKSCFIIWSHYLKRFQVDYHVGHKGLHGLRNSSMTVVLKTIIEEYPHLLRKIFDVKFNNTIEK